jgi:hypothetical protein
MMRADGWIDFLRDLFPVVGVVHVGAGSGSVAARYAEWAVPKAILIEAEEALHAKLMSAAQPHSGWSAHAMLVGESEADTDFFVATNPNESGMLRPDKLTGIWRNLRTCEQRSLRSTTLERLLDANVESPHEVNWVVVDCLPALPILKGAGKRLEDWDVIVARAVLSADVAESSGATRAALEAFLADHSFRCVAWEEERHPAIGRAIFVRDWRSVGRAIAADRATRLASSAEAVEELQVLVRWGRGQNEQIAQERDERTRQLADTRAQRDALAIELAASQVAAAEALGERDRLASARDEYHALAQAGQAEVRRIVEEHDREVSLRAAQLAEQTARAAQESDRLAEREKVILDLQGRIDELGNALESYAAAVEEQARLLAESRSRIAELAASSEGHARLIAQKEAEVGSLSQARDEGALLSASLRAELERAIATIAGQEKLIGELRSRSAELAKSSEDLPRLVSERDAVIARLTKDHDEHARVSRERLAHIEQLLRAQEERQGHIAKLEAERSELDYRQQLLDEELVKAEAQIELIKDVVLREKAF